MVYSEPGIVEEIKKYKETGDCNSPEIKKALDDLTSDEDEEKKVQNEDEGELSVRTENPEED